MDRELCFIKYATAEIYKMLVLREKQEEGNNVFIEDFVTNLFVEINGACVWSEWFKTNKDYNIVASIMAYMSKNTLEFKHYRREVFKMLNLLNKLESELSR